MNSSISYSSAGLSMGSGFPKPSQILEEGNEELTPEALVDLLENGADINFCDDSGHNALMYAAFEGKADHVRVLSRAGADLNMGNRFYGYTPLMLASINCEIESIEALVEEGADPKVLNEYGEQALQHCAMSGCVQGMRCLLRAGVRIDNEDYKGTTALMNAAVFEDSVEPARCAVMNGAHLDQVDKFGRTALIHAAKMSRLKTTRYLVEVGASLDLKDYDGRTALIYAAGSSTKESLAVVQCLVSSGANVNIISTFCGSHYRGVYTALTAAVIRKDPKFISYLMQNGATIDAEVHIAISLGDEVCLQTLISNGAMPNLQSFHHFSAIHYSGSHNDQLSPVQLALFCENSAIFQYLLDNLYMLDNDLMTLTSLGLDSTNLSDSSATILKELFTIPPPLVYLCLHQVSVTIGYGADRQQKIQLTKLPTVFQRKLSFQA